MKKWGFFVVVLIFVAWLAIDETTFIKKADGVEIVEENRKGTGETHKAGGNDQTISIDKSAVYHGNLLLVNSQYPINDHTNVPDAVRLSDNFDLIDGFGLLNNDILLSETLVRKFSDMIEAAAEEGVQHFMISSGYRDAQEQDLLYQEKGASYALPAGYSEHQLGLSLDVGSTMTSMSEAPEGKWLEENAWKYGFVLRYPKDKTHITNIQYEPWHIRYVGLPHSAIMKEKNFVLEEYLNYLKEEEQLTLRVGNKQYTIYYKPISDDTSITVPDQSEYELSGNNIDGVIVTIQD